MYICLGMYKKVAALKLWEHRITCACQVTAEDLSINLWTSAFS